MSESRGRARELGFFVNQPAQLVQQRGRHRLDSGLGRLDQQRRRGRRIAPVRSGDFQQAAAGGIRQRRSVPRRLDAGGIEFGLQRTATTPTAASDRRGGGSRYRRFAGNRRCPARAGDAVTGSSPDRPVRAGSTRLRTRVCPVPFPAPFRPVAGGCRSPAAAGACLPPGGRAAGPAAPREPRRRTAIGNRIPTRP